MPRSKAAKIYVFAAVELSIDDVCGDSLARIIVNSDSEAINACKFSANRYDLSNGDIVTVEIINIDYLAETYHCVPKETKKEYVVSGLGKYITSPDEIPKETIKEYAEKFVADQANSRGDELERSELKYYGSYLYLNYGYGWWNSYDYNQICIYVCYKSYVNEDYYDMIYLPLCFNDVILNADGTLNITYEDGYTATFLNDLEASYAEYEEGTVFDLGVEID